MSDLIERLRARITVSPDGCWLWNRYVRADGYAVFSFVQDGRQLGLYPHREMYKATRGPIPEGAHLDHLCRVRHCLNPDHLEPVTPKTNILRGIGVTSINAHKTHCKHGHPFDETNTRVRPGGSGNWRECITCARAKNARQRAQRKASAA